MKEKWISLIVVFVILLMIITKGSASFNSSTEVWQDTSTDEAPTGRYGHTIIWTGEEMIVWGGYYNINHFLNDGARYDPTTDTWTPTSTENAPIGRLRHTAIWTGEEMIVWGGESGGGGATTNTGGIYNPATDTWTSITTDNAPSAREMHSAIWTGEEMIIWGGCPSINCSQVFNNGGKYNPETDTWIPLPSEAALTPRHFHQAIWTGNRMILWGGTSDYQGISFDPNTNIWTPISSVNAPTPTFQGTSVWTGEEVLVWGGCTVWSTLPCPSYVNSGGRYYPNTDTWRPITANSAPFTRWTHSAIWTGKEMVIWGGCGESCFDSGGKYNPKFDKWKVLTTDNAPSPRSNHKAIWTNTSMIVWGGCNIGGCGIATYYNTGGLISISQPLDIHLPIIIK